MDEFVGFVLEQVRLSAESPALLAAASFGVACSIAALLQWNSARRIATLRENIKSRDSRLAELQNQLKLIRASELQARVSNLKPQARRGITAQQQAILVEHAIVPPGMQFTVEIIHDMAGSDCTAYASDFGTVFTEIGWSISRSAVLGPGWIARCGLGVHVRNRDLLSRPETIVINALAAAGIDYDLVRIPDLEADVGLVVTPTPPNSSAELTTGPGSVAAPLRSRSTPAHPPRRNVSTSTIGRPSAGFGSS